MGQLAHKAAVLAGIVSRKFIFSGPLFANISLSNICNLNCRFCHYRASANHPSGEDKQNKGFLDFDAACRLLDDLHALGTELAIFLGEGEPLLHPKVVNLVEECRKRKMRSEIFTNGLRLNPKLSTELVNSGLGTIRISVMADCAEHYEELRSSGRQKVWEQMWYGINSLVSAKRNAGAAKPQIILHHLICRLTYENLDRMVENARCTGVDGITFTPLVEQSVAALDLVLDSAVIPRVCSNLGEIATALKGTPLSCNAEVAARRLEAGPYFHRHQACWIGWLSTRIQSNGDVLFCHAVDRIAGNLGRQSFREIWQSEEYRFFRRTAGKQGGIMAPELRASCHYCCYFTHHQKIRQLQSVRGLVQSLQNALATED